MAKIFVVFGQTGEYSDRYEWMVRAFSDEDHAKDLVKKATQRANEIYVLYPDQYNVPKDITNEYDPNMERDYTGTSYSYAEVELE